MGIQVIEDKYSLEFSIKCTYLIYLKITTQQACCAAGLRIAYRVDIGFKGSARRLILASVYLLESIT